MDCRNKNVYVIKKTLPVSLGRILQFDIYQAALEHTLSLEEASWEEPMESQKSEIMEVESQTEEEPMDIDELTVKFENLKL